ncbi:TECTA [Branchiostoma lanceolatum]|uniref:TECTA protein n=1 Tax=Branchiostoma lanceolatum TaxID=7740 RepID=A0A8J9Z5S3_BRALA|nr:TECTA [Branchiostoma lanceolatum]
MFVTVPGLQKVEVAGFSRGLFYNRENNLVVAKIRVIATHYAISMAQTRFIQLVTTGKVGQLTFNSSNVIIKRDVVLSSTTSMTIGSYTWVQNLSVRTSLQYIQLKQQIEEQLTIQLVTVTGFQTLQVVDIKQGVNNTVVVVLAVYGAGYATNMLQSAFQTAVQSGQLGTVNVVKQSAVVKTDVVMSSTVSVTLTQSWSNAYANSTTQAFGTLRNTVAQQFTEQLGGTQGFQQVTVSSFEKSGNTVRVVIRLLSTSYRASSEVQTSLLSAVNQGKIGSISVNQTVAVAIKQNVAQSVTSSMTLTRPWTPDLLNVNSMTYKTLKIQIEQSIRESLLQTVGFQAVSVARFKQTSDQKIQVILRIMAVEYAVAQAQQTVQAVVQTGQIGNIAVDANSATVTQDVTVSNTAQMTLTQAWSANLTSTTSATYVSLKNQVETTVAQQFANVVGFQRVVVSNFVRQSGSVAVVVRIVMADYSSTEVQQAFTAAVRTGQMGTLAVNSTSAVVKKDVTVTRSASMTITKPWSAEYVNMTSTVYKAFRTQVEQQLLTVLLSVVGVQGVRVASIKESSGNIEVLVRLVLADYASKGAQTSFQTVVSSGKIGTLTVDPASAVVKKDVSITSTASMTLTQPWSADLMNPSAPQYVTLKKQVEQAFSESLIVVLGFQRVALHKFVRTESNKTQVVLRIITADYSAADVSRRFEVIAQEREVGPRAFTVKNATTTNFKRDASISSTTSAVLTQSWSVQLINKTSQEYRSLTQQLEDEISIILVQNVGFKRVNVKEYKQSSDGKVEVTTRVTIAPYALLETQSSFLEATKTGQLGTIQVLNTSVTIVEDVSQSATSSMVLTEEWNPQLQNTDSVVYKELKTKIEQTLLVNLLQTPGFQNVEVANFMKTESNQTQVVVRIISTADTLKETQQNFVSLVEKNQLKGVTVSTTSATTRRDVASSTSAFLTLSEQTWTTDLLNTSSSVFVTLKERVEDGLTEQIANTLGVQRIAVTGFHEEKGKTVVDVKIIKADYATEEVRQAFAAVVQSGSILGLAVNRTTAMIENDVITSSTASLVLKTEKWTANLTDEKSPQFGALASKVEEQIRTVLVPTVGFLEANIVQFRQSDTNVEAIVAILKSDYATNEVRTAFTTAVSDGTVGTLQVNSSTVGYKTDVGITSTVSLVVKQEWNEDLANVSSVAYKNLEKRVEKGFFQALITTVGFQRVEVSRFAREMNQTRAKIRVLSADYATAKVQATVLEVASTGQVGTLPVDPASVEIKRDVSTTTTASFVLSQNFNPKLTNKTTEYQVLKKKVELELLEVLVDQDIGFKQVDVSEIKQGVAGKTEVVLRIMVAPYALSTIETSFVNAISSGQLVTLPVEKFSATFTKDVSVSSTATMTVTQSWSNELQDKTSKAYKDLQIRVEQEMTEKLVQTVGFHTIRVVNFKKTEANQVQVTVRIVAAGYSLTQAQQAFVRLVQTGRVVTIPVMSTSATVRKDVTKSRTAQMTLTKKWSAELTNMTSVVSTTLSKEVEEALRVELSATPGFQRIVIVDFKNSSTSTVVVTTRLMTASYAVKNIQNVFESSVSSGKIGTVTVQPQSAVVTEDVSTSATVSMSVPVTWSVDFQNKSSQAYQDLKVKIEQNVNEKLLTTAGLSGIEVTQLKQTQSGKVEVILRVVAAQYALTQVQQNFVTLVQTGRIGTLNAISSSAIIKKDVTLSKTAEMTVSQVWSAELTNTSSKAFTMLKTQVQEAVTSELVDTIGFQRVDVTTFKQGTSNTTVAVMRMIVAAYASKAVETSFQQVVSTGQVGTLRLNSTSATIITDVSVSSTMIMSVAQNWTMDLVNKTTEAYTVLVRKIEQEMNIELGNTVGFQRVVVTKFTKSSNNTVVTEVRMITAAYAVNAVENVFVQAVSTGQVQGIAVDKASANIVRDVSVSSQVTMTMNQTWSQEYLNTTTAVYKQLKTKIEETMTKTLLTTVGFQGLQVVEFKRTESNNIRVVVNMVTAQYAQTVSQQAFVNAVTTGQIADLAVVKTSAAIQKVVTTSQTAQVTVNQPWSSELMNKTTKTFITLQKQVENGISVELGNTIGFQRAMVVNFKQSSSNTIIVTTRLIAASYATGSVQSAFVSTVTNGQINQIVVDKASAKIVKDVSTSSSVTMTLNQSWSANFTNVKSVTYQQLKAKIEESITTKMLTTFGVQGVQVAGFKQTVSSQIQVILRIVAAQYAQSAAQQMFVTVVQTGQIDGLSVITTSAVVQKDVTVSQTAQMTLTKTWSADLVNMTSASSVELKTQLQESLSVVFGNTVGFQRVSVVEFKQSSSNTVAVITRIVVASYATTPVQTIFVTTVKSGRIGVISVNTASVVVKQDVSTSSTVTMTVKQAWSTDLMNVTTTSYQTLKTKVEEAMTEKLLMTVGFQGLEVAEFRRTESNTTQVIVRIVTAQYAATATQNAFVTVVTTNQVTGLAIDNTSAVIQNDVTVSQTAQMTLTQQWSVDLVNKTSVTFTTLQTQLQESLSVEFGTVVGFQRADVVQFSQSATNTTVVVVRMIVTSYAAPAVQTNFVTTVSSGQLGGISVTANSATVKKDVSVSSSLSLAVTQAWSADLQDTTSVAYKQLKTQVEETMTLQLLETVGFQGLQVAEFRRTESNTIQVVVRIVTAQYAATATQNAFVTVVTKGQVVGLAVDNTSAVVQKDGFQRAIVVGFTKSSTNTIVVTIRMIMASYAAKPVQTTVERTVQSGQLGGISVNPAVAVTVKQDVSVSSSLSLAVKNTWSADLQTTTSVAYKQLKTQVEESMTLQLLETVGFQGLQVAEFRRTESNTIQVIVRIVTAQYAATATQQAFVTVVTSGQVTGLSVDNTSAVVQKDVTVSQTAQMTLTKQWSADLVNKTSKAFITMQTQLQEALTVQFGTTVGFQRVNIVEFTQSSTNTVVVVVRMVMASYAAGPVQTALVQTVASGQIGTISVNSNVTATVKKDVSVSSSLSLAVTQVWSADLQDTTSVAYKQLKTQVEESMTVQLLNTVGFQGLQVAEFRRTKTNTIEVIVRIVTAQYAATATQQAFVTVVTSGQVTGLKVDNTSAVVQNDVTVSQTAQMTLTQRFSADLANKTSKAFVTLQTQLQESLSIQFGNTVGFQRVVVVEFAKSSTNTVVVVVRVVVASYAASDVQNTFVQTVTSGQLGGISINSNVTATVKKDVTLSSSAVMTLTQSWSADLKDKTSVAYRQLQTKIEESLTLQLLQTVGFQGLQVTQFKQTQSNRVEVVIVIAAAEYAVKQTQQSFVTMVRSGNVGSLSVDASSVVVKNDIVVSQTAQMTLSQTFTPALVNKESAVFIALQTKLQDAISVQMGNTLGFQRVVVVEFQNSTSNSVVVVMRMVMASYAAKTVQTLYQASVSAGQIGGISVVPGSSTVTKDVVASASVSMTMAQSWSADLLNVTSQTYQQLTIQIEEVISQILVKILGAQAAKVGQFKRTKSGQVEVVLRLAATDYAIKTAQQSVITQVRTGNLGGLAVVNTSAVIKKDVTVSQTAQMTLTQAWSADLQNTSSQAYITLVQTVQESLSVQLGNTLGFQRVVVVEFKQSSTNTVVVVTRLVVASYAASNVQASFAQAVSSGEISGLAVNSTSAVVTKDVSVSSSVTMTVAQAWSAQLQDQSSQNFTTLKNKLEEELTRKMATITGFQGVQVAQFKRSESGQVQAIVRVAAADHAIAQAQQTFVTVVQSGTIAGVSVDASSANIQKTVTTSQTAQMTLTQAWSADLQNTTSVAFTTLQTKLQESLSVELGNTLGFQRVVVTEFKKSSSNTVIVVMRLVVATYASSAVQNTFTEAVSIGQIGTITVDSTSAAVTKDVSTSSSVSMTVNQAWSAQLLNTSSTEYVTFKTRTEQALTKSMLNVVGFSGLEVGQLKQSSSGKVLVKLRIVAAEYALAQAQQSFVTVVQSGNVEGISVDTASAVIQKDVTTSQTAEVTLTQAYSADLQNTTSVAFTTLQQKVQDDLSVELGNTVGFQRAVVVEFKQSSTNTVVAVTRLVVATYAASAAQSAFVKTVSSGQIGTIAVNATSATVSKDVSASSTMSMTVTQPFSADLLNSSSTAYQALVVKIEKSMTSTLLTTVGFQAFEVARFKKTSSGQVEVVVRVVAAEYALAAAQQSFVTVVKTGSVAGLSLDTTSAVVKKTVTASQTAQMTLTQAWSADLQQTSSATFTTLQTTVQEALTVELGNTVGFQSVNVVSFKESSTSTVTAVVRMIVVSYATTSVQNSFTQVVSSGQVGTITVNKTSAVVKKDVGLSTTVSMTVTQAWSTDLQNTTSQAFITLQTNIQQAMTKSLQATTGFQAVQVSQFKQTQSGKVQVILRIVAAEYALTTAQESFTTVVQTGSVAGVSVDASSAVVQKDVTVSRTLQMTIKQAFTAALQDTSSEAFVTLKTQVQDAVTEEMSATVGFQRAVVAEFKQDSSSTVAVIRTVMASYASNEVQNAFVTVVKSGQVGNLVVDANSATIKQDVTVTRTASVTLNQVWSATLLNKSSTEFKTLQTQTETQMTSVLLVIVGIQGVTVSEFKDSSSKAEAVVRLVVADYASKDSQTSFANVVKTGTIGTISVDPTSAVIKKDVSITSTTSMTLTQSFTADLTNTTSAAFIALKTKVEQSISETLIQTVGFQRVEIVEFVRTESGQVQAKVRIVVADFATNTVQTAFTTAVKTGSVGALTVDPTSVVVEKDVSTTSTISMKMTSVTWNAALLNTSSTTFSSLKLDVEESLLLVMVSVVGFQRVEVAEFKQSSGNVEVVLRMMVTSYASAGVSTSFTQVVATGNIGTITVDPTSALVTKDVNVATKVAMTVTQTWNQQLTNTSSTVYTQLKTQLETSLQQTFLTIVGFQRVEIQEFKKVGSNIQVIIILVVAQYATTSVSTSFSSVVSSGTIGTITVDVNSATEEKVVPVTRSTTVSLTETWNAALLDSSSTQSKTLKTKVENSFFEVFVFITGFQRVTVVEFKESSGVVSVVLRISLSFAASSSFVTTIKTAVSSGKIAAVSVNPASLQLAVDQRVVQQATFKLTQPWSANLLVVTSTEFITLKKTVETQFFQTFVNINGFQSVTVKEFQESSGTVTVIFYIIVAEFATTTVSTTFTTAVQSGTVGTLTVVTTSAAVTVPVERTIYGNIVVSNSYDCNLVDMTSSNYTGFVSQFTTNAPQALPLIPGFKSFEALWLGTWRDGGILVNIKLNVSEATTKDDVQQWLKTISEGGDFGDLKLKVAYGAAASEAELPQPAQADFQLLNLTLSTASPKQIHPAGVVKTKFDFFIKNLGNVDVGVTPNGFATFKAYLTNNAELESATVKSNATGVSVPVSSEALLHVGVQKKGTEQIGMMNVVAPLEVPASNCAAFTHVCINAVTADVPAFFDYQPCNNDVCYELKAVGAGGGLEKNCPRITGVCSPACDTHATCHRESGSPTCECDHGYTGNGQTCTDINECSTNPCDASANQVCKNLEGSFECTCNPGYKLKDGVCVATSQFRSNVRFTSLTYTADLANPTSTVYINTVRTVVITVTKVFKLSTVRSSFVGVTVLGFSPGSVKADVSLDVASDANLTPSDMSGAFQNGSAALNDSSLGLDTSSTVTDFNECANGTDNDCSPYANCNNTVGGFSCSCLDGFLDNSTDSTRPGRICVNITKPSAAPPTTAFTVPPTASMRPPNATAPPTAAPTASVSAPSIPASLLRGPSTGLPTIRPTTAGTQQATAVPPSLSLSPGIKPTAPLTAAPTVAPTGSLGLQPSTAAVAPTAASPGAGQTTAPGVQPTASVQPTGPVVQPTASVQPTAPVVQPTASVQPTAPVVKPTGSIQPSAPAVQPSASVQPTAPVVKPTGSIQPSAPVVQPTASVQPTVVVAQPTASVQPTVPVVKPTGSQELQPSPSAGAPGETQSTAPVAPSASAGQATADPSAGLQGTAVPSASAAPVVQPSAPEVQPTATDAQLTPTVKATDAQVTDSIQPTAPAVQPTASVAPSVAASASPAPTTAGPTGTLPPGTAVVEAGTVKVNSRSPNTFSPAESVTMQFDYTFENKGNTDIPASNTTNAVLKVYLTNNAQFESATIKSPPSPVTLSAFDSALTRQGIKQGASFRALDATATVSVPEANCASFTHLCTVVTYAGLSSAYADKADTCLPLGSGSNQAGVLDCNKVTQTTCSGCASNAVCASVSGTAKCVCKGGFTGDGTTCTDVNECTSGSPCSSLANSRCVNTVGSYECQCVPRYYKNRRECKATETYQVEVTFTAYNYTSGLANSDSTEYKQLEYTYSEEMSNVYLTSTLKDSFHGLRVLNFRSGSVIGTHAANLASNSGQSTSSIKNAVNSAIGSTAGTPLNMQASVKVADYNECAKASDHDCHEKADCVNTMGSFTCKCKTGYEDRNPSTPGKDCYDAARLAIIIGGVIGGLLALLLLACLFHQCIKNRRGKKKSVDLKSVDSGAGSLVWARQDPRTFWWPGEVVPGKDGDNSLWVKWLGINTFSPVDSVEVDKFQSLNQHFSAKAHSSLRSYRAGIDEVKRKSMPSSDPEQAPPYNGHYTEAQPEKPALSPQYKSLIVPYYQDLQPQYAQQQEVSQVLARPPRPSVKEPPKYSSGFKGKDEYQEISFKLK